MSRELTPEQKQHRRQIAQQQLYGSRNDYHPRCVGELERSNCSACVLQGYIPPGGWEGMTDEDGPNYSGWALVYVEAGARIPGRWKEAFEQELERTDNPAYVQHLAATIDTFGHPGYGKVER